MSISLHGAVNGFADPGRDLIVKSKKEIFVLQTKYWSKEKVIHEDHIFKLWVSTANFKQTLNENERRMTKPVFFTTTNYSDLAKEAARLSGVEIRTEEFDRTYPMIKCNVGVNGEKIFHLPFDMYYDKVKIKPQKGEFFAKSVDDAIQKGFRRSRR